MKIAELFAELGFETNASQEAKLRDFANVLGDMSLSSLAAAAGLGILGLALAEIANEASKYAIGVENFSTITGLSVKNIQAWEQAVERAGGSTDDFRASFKAVQKLMLEVKMGTNAGNTAMSVFGINVADDELEIFRKMSKVLKEDATPALKSMMTAQMGVTEGMQKFLQTADIDKAIKDSPVLSTETITEFASLWKAVTTTMQEFKKAAYDAASVISPGLRLLLTILTDISLVLQIIVAAVKQLMSLGGNAINTALGGTQDLLGIPKTFGGGIGTQSNTISFHLDSSKDHMSLAKMIEETLRSWLSGVSYQDSAGSV